MDNDFVTYALLAIVLLFVLIYYIKNKTVSLHDLASNGDIKALEKRINSVNINEVDKIGDTLLHNAVFYGELECAEFLLKHGASTNIGNNIGDTPIFHASDDLEMMQLLVRYRADINRKNDVGSSVLMDAVSDSDNIEVVKFLIHKGIDINIKNNYGFTALHEAAINSGTIEHLELLLSKGLDINALNNDSMTPLDIAYERENFDLVEYFIAQGAKYNIYKDNE